MLTIAHLQCYPHNMLFAEIKFFDDRAVAGNVCFVQVVKQAATLTHQTDQAALRSEVLLVHL